MPVARMAMVPAMLLMTAATTAGPAFETPAPTATIPATVSAAIGTPAPGAAIPSATAERPLKARAGIAAADARGLAREFSQWLQRSARVADACPGFAGQQNDVFLDDRRPVCRFIRMGICIARDFVSFARCVDFDMFAQSRDVQGVLVRSISFRFGYCLR